MTEAEQALVERVKKCENQIEILRNNYNKIDKSQVAYATKLDNVLVELGRLRESIESFKARPAKMWEKFVYAIIGALASGFVAFLIK